MDYLWDINCIKARIDDFSYMTNLGLQSNIDSAATDKIFYYHRGLKESSPSKPVLVLLHGYPQTSFLWRHVVDLLPKDIPLFIPDLPGYGRSSPLSIPHDKRNVGQAILKALHPLLPVSSEPPSIILAGHDRGARVCHRLSVDATAELLFKLKGTILLDIVPTVVQWQSFTNPVAAVSTYHWPLLANVDLATAMIKSLGPETFVKTNIERWHGQNAAGVTKFNEQDAMSVYASSFKYESVVRASCDDYRAGAFEDITEQEGDQKSGKKLEVDTLIIYSAGYLGSRYDVEKVWREWMGNASLETDGFEDGVGHFIPEEAPQRTAEAIRLFYCRHT